MPKQHNALYGADLHNPKGMGVESYASASKFTVSASNMTITASGYTIKASAFQGDGSGLTGVPANDWDGSHTGDGVITGDLEVRGDTSGSSTSTGSFGRVDVVGRVVASQFFGNGANLVGVTADWDGSHTGDGNISGTLTAGEFVGGGAGITGITGEWDGTHTGTATFTGNVTASGVVSASGGFVGDGSNLTGVGGGGLTHNFFASSSLVAGDGVIINSDGSVKKIEEVATAVDIPLKDGTAYNTAGYEFDGAHANYRAKFISYDPQQADIFVIAWKAMGNSNSGRAIVGTVSGDDGLITFGTASPFRTTDTEVHGVEYIPGQSSKFVVYYHKNTNGSTGYRNAARVGSISGTGASATIAWGTEVELPTPTGTDGRSYNGSLAMDPNDTDGKFVVLSRRTHTSSGNPSSGSAWVGTVSGTSITFTGEYQYESDQIGYTRIAADSTQTGKFAIIYQNTVDYALKSKVATLSGTTLSFGAKTAVIAGSYAPGSVSFDPNDTGKLIATYISGTNMKFHAGILSGTGITWGTAYTGAQSGYEAQVKFNPLVKGQWAGVAKWAGGNAGYLYVVKGTLSGTTFSSGTTVDTDRFLVGTGPSTDYQSINIAFDSQKSGKFTFIFGGHGGYETGKGRASVGQLDVTSTNLTATNWAGMATGTTSLNGTASITTRGGVATGVTGSGLTPGTIYYLQGDSSLATTADTPSVKAGRALSATSIILTPSPINVDGTPYATSTQGDTADTALTNAATAQTTADAALPKAGGAMTGAITTNSTFDGVDIATRDGILTSTTTTAGAALPKAGGAMTGAITTNSTFDGVDIATRDGILTTTTTTAGAALPKAGGTMTGTLIGTSANFSGNVTASGVVSASGGFVGSGAGLTGLSSFAGAAGTETLFSGSVASTGSFGRVEANKVDATKIFFDSTRTEFSYQTPLSDVDISFVGYSNGGAISGLAEDDLMIYIVASKWDPHPDTDALDDPDGFTWIKEDFNGTMALNTYYKVCPSTVPTSFADVDGTYGSHMVVAFRGIDTSTPFDVTATATTGTSTTPDPTSITTANNKAVVLAAIAVGGNTQTFSAGPLGYGDLSQVSHNASYTKVGAAWKEVGTAGAENPGAFTMGISYAWIAHTIAIRKYVATSQVNDYSLGNLGQALSGGVSGSSVSTGSFGKVEGEGSGLTNLQRPITTHITNFPASNTYAGHYNIVSGQQTCSILHPTSASVDIGAEFEFFQTSSAGTMLFETSSAGATQLLSKDGAVRLTGQYSGASLKKVATDTWQLVGDLS